jgi:hypothetical protein
MTAKKLIIRMKLENPDVTTEELMIEFAKYHTQLALIQANHNAKSELTGQCWSNVYDRNFLLRSYSLDNIN